MVGLQISSGMLRDRYSYIVDSLLQGLKNNATPLGVKRITTSFNAISNLFNHDMNDIKYLFNHL